MEASVEPTLNTLQAQASDTLKLTNTTDLSFNTHLQQPLLPLFQEPWLRDARLLPMFSFRFS